MEYGTHAGDILWSTTLGNVPDDAEKLMAGAWHCSSLEAIMARFMWTKQKMTLEQYLLLYQNLIIYNVIDEKYERELWKRERERERERKKEIAKWQTKNVWVRQFKGNRMANLFYCTPLGHLSSRSVAKFILGNSILWRNLYDSRTLWVIIDVTDVTKMADLGVFVQSSLFQRQFLIRNEALLY